MFCLAWEGEVQRHLDASSPHMFSEAPRRPPEGSGGSSNSGPVEERRLGAKRLRTCVALAGRHETDGEMGLTPR